MRTPAQKSYPVLVAGKLYHYLPATNSYKLVGNLNARNRDRGYHYPRQPAA